MGKIESSNYRLIEAELFTYNETKKEIEELEDDIINTSPFVEASVQCSIPDATASKAIKLSSCKELIEIRRRINAIEKVLSILPKEKLELIKLKYFERNLTDVGIMNKLNIGNNTYYRWKKDIIKLIGSYLGWRV